jgi:CheY-like chemotaxis protein
MLYEMLTHEGYSAYSAETGQAALDWLERNQAPCLVLLDMKMPGLSGEQVVSELDRLGIRQRVSVVFTTASHPSMLPAGMPYLYKPYDLETLFTMVEEHCQNRESPRQ